MEPKGKLLQRLQSIQMPIVNHVPGGGFRGGHGPCDVTYILSKDGVYKFYDGYYVGPFKLTAEGVIQAEKIILDEHRETDLRNGEINNLEDSLDDLISEFGVDILLEMIFQGCQPNINYYRYPSSENADGRYYDSFDAVNKALISDILKHYNKIEWKPWIEFEDNDLKAWDDTLAEIERDTWKEQKRLKLINEIRDGTIFADPAYLQMRAQKEPHMAPVVWIPQWLIKNSSARVLLGVVVPSQLAKELDDPKDREQAAFQYSESWKEKFLLLLLKRLEEGILEGISDSVESIFSKTGWLFGTWGWEALFNEVRGHVNANGCETTLRQWLREGKLELKEELLEIFPQEEEPVSQEEMLREQKDLSLGEFLEMITY